MKTKPNIPESLRTYAASALGSFQSRYDQILDRAFTEHQMMLNVSTLRALAGGGSSTTAQESLDRFRSRLNTSMVDRVKFGRDIPEELSNRMSASMTELWIEASRFAQSEFDQLRSELESKEQDLKDVVESLKSRCNGLIVEKEQALEAIKAVDEQVHQLRIKLGAADTKNVQLNEMNKSLGTTSDLLRSQNASIQAALDAARGQVKDMQALHATEKEQIRQQSTIQMQDIRREHAGLVEKLTKERDVARSGEARERSVGIEATIELARSEQKLWNVTRQLDETSASNAKQLKEALERATIAEMYLKDQMAIARQNSALIDDLKGQLEVSNRS